jgi:tRNA(Ile)-lysidine synthase
MKVSAYKGQNIGVAVSGGADSMVLLHLLLKEGAIVSVVNVDHGIRGQASARDSDFVREFCQKNGLPFYFKKVDAPALAEKEGISVELAARELRYAFFEELLKEKKVDIIALAHHLDDQAETVLMRFFRGTGARGLRGIVDREGYIHPLLDYSKAEILEYAARNGIGYVTDDTNFDSGYRRNFIRNEVMPLLQTRYPDLPKTIRKNALVFEEIEDFLCKSITPCKKDGRGVALPVTVLDRHPAVAKKSIAEALRVLGIMRDIEYGHLEGVLALRNAPNNARVNLPFGVDAIKEYSDLRFVLRPSGQPFEAPYMRDGVYEYEGTKIAFRKGSEIKRGLTFDEDKLPEGAVVRTRQAGDRFRRYKGKEKSLSDYLTDIKLPLSGRNRLLVLAKGSEVYAVLGIEVADAVKIDKNTKNIIEIVSYEGDD